MTTTPPTLAAAPDDAVRQMRDCIDAADGFSRRRNMERASALVGTLYAAGTQAMVSDLSDAELGAWFDDVDALGVAGLEGLSADQQSALFAELAREVTDGAQLDRLVRVAAQRSTAFLDRVVTAVVVHAGIEAKQQLVSAHLRTVDFGAARHQASQDLGLDRNAQLLARVVGSLPGPAFAETVGAMNASQLGAVTAGAVGGHIRMPLHEHGDFVAVAHMDRLAAFVDTALESGDVRVQARVFAHAAHIVDDYEGDEIGSRPGTRTMARQGVTKPVLDALTRLLDTDTRGIVHEIALRPPVPEHERPLVAYLTQLYLEDVDTAKNVMRRQLRQMSGEGTGQTPNAFLTQGVTAPNGDVIYRRAKDFDHYWRAVPDAVQRTINAFDRSTARASNIGASGLLAFHSLNGVAIGNLPIVGALLRGALVFATVPVAAGVKLLNDDDRRNLRAGANQVLFEARSAAAIDGFDFADFSAGRAVDGISTPFSR